MQRLVSMLQQAEDYVGTVVDGNLPADPHMGRKVNVALVLNFFRYVLQLLVWHFCSFFFVQLIVSEPFCLSVVTYPCCRINPPGSYFSDLRTESTPQVLIIAFTASLYCFLNNFVVTVYRSVEDARL